MHSRTQQVSTNREHEFCVVKRLREVVTGSEAQRLEYAIVIYVRTQKPRDAVGKWAFWALVTLIGVIWITQPWSPPPPGSTAVAAVTLALWLLPWWASWIERHRSMDAAG